MGPASGMPDAGHLVVASELVTYQDAVEAFQEFLGISALAAFLILEQPDGMPGSERAAAVAPHVGFRGVAFGSSAKFRSKLLPNNSELWYNLANN